jgi:hypothetical protein
MGGWDEFWHLEFARVLKIQQVKSGAQWHEKMRLGCAIIGQ